MSALRQNPDGTLDSRSSGIHEAFASLRPSRGHRVLVIDESPSVRKLTQTQLARLGCSVVATGDGVAGLELGLRSPFDVIVVTESLPQIAGIAICRIISVLPSERRPLIIFHAAHSISRSEARSAGADLVLSSNDGADNLVSWVRVYLASRPVREMPNGPAPGQDTIHQNLIEDHSWAEDGLA